MSKVISNEEQTQQTSTNADVDKEKVLPSLAKLLKAVSEKLDADMFLYSG